MLGPCDPLFEFWDTLNISGTVVARNFKFGTETEGVSSIGKKCKIGSKGVMWGSRDTLFEFWDTLNISGTVEARNFKLGTETEGVSSIGKNAKLRQKGSCWSHVTQFWNFGTPLISRERLKLETSNLARRHWAVSSNGK